MKSHTVLLVVLVSLSFHAGAFAQTLADVARAEETRRKTVKAAAKVYTNEDLGRTPETSPAPAPAAAGAAKPADPAAKAEESKQADPTKSEKYWKDRAATIQQSIARNKLVFEALQSQVNSLTAEILNTDDPGQRGLLEARLQRATGELQRVQQDIEKQTKAAADLQEEARKSGAPAGWLR